MYIWLGTGEDQVDVEVGPYGFYILSALSESVPRGLFLEQCRLWKLKGEYVLVNCKPQYGTFIGRKLTRKDEGAGSTMVEIPEDKLLLGLRVVNEPVTLDLAVDTIFLGIPERPGGHALVSFDPDGSDYRLVVRLVRAIKVK